MTNLEVKTTKKSNWKFNQEIHDICDPFGKKAVSNWLDSKGIDYLPAPNGKYKEDIMSITTDGTLIYYDPEVNRSWGSACNEYPYEFLTIPARKGKFKDKDKTIFCNVRNDGKVFYMTSGKLLTDDRLFQKLVNISENGRTIKKLEWFYKIDWKTDCKRAEVI